MPIKQALLNTERAQGFSILEIVIALTIFAFLAYGIASTQKTGRDYNKYFENRKVLEEAKVAVITFAQTNGYLPCPDGGLIIDGLEDRTSGICASINGRLPYRTLGLPAFDEWGAHIYYAIPTNANTSASADDPTLMASYFNANAVAGITGSPPVFDLNTAPNAAGAVTGSNKICGENAVTCVAATPAADMVETAAVAVLVSFGDNGEFTWNNLGNALQFSTKEFENTDGDNYFWKESGSYAEDFDDQLVWITGFDIKSAMLRSDIGLRE